MDEQDKYIREVLRIEYIQTKRKLFGKLGPFTSMYHKLSEHDPKYNITGLDNIKESLRDFKGLSDPSNLHTDIDDAWNCNVISGDTCDTLHSILEDYNDAYENLTKNLF